MGRIDTFPTTTTVNGYTVHYQAGEPMIQDLELAERLGYSEPRMIRKLIKRMLEKGQLREGQFCDAVSQNTGKRGRPGKTYYLGEFACLKVTTQAETAKADQITNEIIQVFIDVRRGQVPSATPIQPQAQPVLSSTQAKLEIARAAADMLRLSETSKLRMLADVAKSEGIDSSFLPAYVNEPLVRAISHLLKSHGSALSAQAANKALIAMGIIEELERPSKGATKRFKSLTEAGLKYGCNENSPQNPRETQPLYYEHTFPELLAQIEAYLKANPRDSQEEVERESNARGVQLDLRFLH